MSHTPGPWHHDYRNWLGDPDQLKAHVYGNVHECHDDDDEESCEVATAVAIVEGNETSREVTEANALLIAAAPELLEACRALLNSTDCYCDKIEWENEICPHMLGKAAIAKATRGQ